MTPHTSTRFFHEDVVRWVRDTSNNGVVLRCWHDNDNNQFPVFPPDPLLRSLNRGEVGVLFHTTEEPVILPETELELLDRPFQVGDVCKRSYEDPQSAVVINATVGFKLAHAISGKPIDEWKSSEDLKSCDDIFERDFVIFDDWVGQVIELFDVVSIQTSAGNTVCIPDDTQQLKVGERGTHLIPDHPEGIQRFISYFTNARPSSDDVVISVDHIVYVISWMAINQTLSREEAESRKRPKTFWFGADISKLTLVHENSGQIHRVGDRVTLTSTPNELVTTHNDGNGRIINVDKLIILETKTVVEIQWQDGLKEVVTATNLIPYLNPDEYDCWPGDHVLWKNEEEQCSVVIQSVNARERTAEILLTNGLRQLVSVLELNPHGEYPDSGDTQDSFGVHRGDFVFIHKEGCTNGCKRPLVPAIGEFESWVHEYPPGYRENGQLTGWRKTLDELGKDLTSLIVHNPNYKIHLPVPDEGQIDWFGEVTNFLMDGLVEVTLPSLRKVRVPIERLTRLRENMEQFEDLLGDDISNENTDNYSFNEGSYEVQGEDGTWARPEGRDEGDWEDANEDITMAEDEPMDVDTDEVGSEASDTVPGAWPSDSEEEEDIDTNFCAIPRIRLSRNAVEKPPSAGSSTTNRPNSQISTSDVLQDVSWAQFDILSSAPADHAFLSTPAGQPSRQFLAHLAKEYRALSSSLPELIIVRTYEDRMDLLRSLIIGPSGTPYEDAPFVIDWKLNDNFPQTPPIAHFLSWTNGNGRVNPNLYEEGKVCLSILGTWAGDQNESWNPSRSSLLQAFVSIQGLVLVKEPYFCEPIHEKWKGTEEGRINSRYYSEKAYVLSRGFVRRALEIPPSGLEDVLQDIYIKRGKLKKIVESAHNLIELSKTLKDDDTFESDLAIPRLTSGGTIPLSRTLERLESILKSSTGNPERIS